MTAEQTPSDWEEGDVVCVGIIPRGQTVDWSPGSREPDPAKWIAEATFEHMLHLSAKCRVPVLRSLDIYAQTRLGPEECELVLTKWSEVERRLRGTPGEAAAAAFRSVVEQCLGSSDDVELLIEGP